MSMSSGVQPPNETYHGHSYSYVQAIKHKTDDSSVDPAQSSVDRRGRLDGSLDTELVLDKSSSRPRGRNMGSVDVGSICEQTPVMVGGGMWRFESVHAAYHGSLTPGTNYRAAPSTRSSD